MPVVDAKFDCSVLSRCHWYLYSGSVLRSIEIVPIFESEVPSFALKVKLSVYAETWPEFVVYVTEDPLKVTEPYVGLVTSEYVNESPFESLPLKEKFIAFWSFGNKLRV